MNSLDSLYGPRRPVRRLTWGDDAAVTALLSEQGGAFDVVVGTDLMYFSIDVHALVRTAAGLLRGHGVVLLAHVFRTSALPAQLLEACDEAGLQVYEVPLADAVGGLGEGLAEGVHSNMRVLVCLPKGLDAGGKALLSRLPQSTRPFQEGDGDGSSCEEEDGREDDGQEEGGLGLSSLFAAAAWVQKGTSSTSCRPSTEQRAEGANSAASVA